MTVSCRPDPTTARLVMPETVVALTPHGDIWADLIAARRGMAAASLADVPVYGPLVAGGKASALVVGQFGQSLDGRIATPSGESKYLNGAGGLQHLHRLRALVDAVVVGASTAVIDDPFLTVRHVEGASPARVVIDPNGRVPRDVRIFAEDGPRRVIVTAEDTSITAGGGVEIVRIARHEGRLVPGAILAALRKIGLAQMLIEGGADTVSRFLEAGCLDRLHVSVAPVLVGGGRSGVTLNRVQGLADCLRPRIEVHRLGDDVLFDCAFETASLTRQDDQFSLKSA